MTGRGVCFVPSLPVGPCDRVESPFPDTVFARRLDSVRDAMVREGVDVLVVHGDTFDDAPITFLGGVIPRLGPSFVIVPRVGAPSCFFSGGPGMTDAAQRTAWVDDIRPLNAAGEDLRTWIAENSGRAPSVALWAGTHLAYSDWKDLREAVGKAPLPDLTATFSPFLHCLTEAERTVIARAAAIAQMAMEAIDTHVRAGDTRLRASLAAERVALRQGAQEIRILLSTSATGVPEVLSSTEEDKSCTRNAYVAVRVHGYWADLTTGVGEPDSLQHAARRALRDRLLRLSGSISLRNEGPTQEGSLVTVHATHRVGLELGGDASDIDADTLVLGAVFSLSVAVREGGRWRYASTLVFAAPEGAKEIPWQGKAAR